jgi:subtilisin family serine protease
VIATVALGNRSEKASYSSYGDKRADVSAPGGNFDVDSNLEDYCAEQVTSTIPGNAWACFQGTSMASPHAAGVAALIASQFGTAGADGDVVISPSKVTSILQRTAIDIGKSGYDECFGYGRIDALRAVRDQHAPLVDKSAPFCPEYGE